MGTLLGILFTLALTLTSHASVSAAELEPLILGGDTAIEGQFPFQVSVLRLGWFPSWSHRCGGSIISKNWVLTTASCTHKAWFLRVAAGKIDLAKKEEGEQILKISKTVVHPDFNPRDVQPMADVALLRTSSNFQYTFKVRPARLPLSEFDAKGGALIVTGWGVMGPGGLFGWGRRWAKKLQVTMVETTPCEGNDHKKGLCIIRESATTPCEGDEGGALVQMLHDYTFTLVGMVTKTPKDCKNESTQSAAVSVFELSRFIQDTMQAN